ncbi:hypothetical protein FK220_002870 [Flavobacteriaceae bacterium TP-CH-4]|uniref:FHA domain-containing protein n=1 Tax=Pelagihabitans pacificus TaxID=2696054 RepID=A0A967AQD9_9FLAO|nr:hypothetical protein [Pelagihabitans pacificus]NHF58269.1 hypothetical protein [Pelagihabitans pacificus]
MKCAEYYLDNHKIEIHYSLFGTESVFVNGNKISEQRSSLKKPHHFVLGNNRYDIYSKLDIAGPSGKDFQIHKNGAAVSLVNFKSQNSKALLFLIVVLGTATGYVIGLYLFQLYFGDF